MLLVMDVTSKPFYFFHLLIMSSIFLFIRNYLQHAVVQLVEALRYKPEGRGFDSR
jgi:membrane-associated PAP2 superfamily phosphatase